MTPVMVTVELTMLKAAPVGTKRLLHSKTVADGTPLMTSDATLLMWTGTQGHERSADALHSVGDSFAGRRHVARGRVGAVHGVDGD